MYDIHHNNWKSFSNMPVHNRMNQIESIMGKKSQQLYYKIIKKVSIIIGCNKSSPNAYFTFHVNYSFHITITGLLSTVTSRPTLLLMYVSSGEFSSKELV